MSPLRRGLLASAVAIASAVVSVLTWRQWATRLHDGSLLFAGPQRDVVDDRALHGNQRTSQAAIDESMGSVHLNTSTVSLFAEVAVCIRGEARGVPGVEQLIRQNVLDELGADAFVVQPRSRKVTLPFDADVVAPVQAIFPKVSVERLRARIPEFRSRRRGPADESILFQVYAMMQCQELIEKHEVHERGGTKYKWIVVIRSDSWCPVPFLPLGHLPTHFAYVACDYEGSGDHPCVSDWYGLYDQLAVLPRAIAPVYLNFSFSRTRGLVKAPTFESMVKLRFAAAGVKVSRIPMMCFAACVHASPTSWSKCQQSLPVQGSVFGKNFPTCRVTREESCASRSLSLTRLHTTLTRNPDLGALKVIAKYSQSPTGWSGLEPLFRYKFDKRVLRYAPLLLKSANNPEEPLPEQCSCVPSARSCAAVAGGPHSDLVRRAVCCQELTSLLRSSTMFRLRLNVTSVDESRRVQAVSEAAMSKAMNEPGRGWSSLFLKLTRAEPVHVLVMGGSMTAGSGCEQVVGERTVSRQYCAWPERFRQWLQGTFPASNITLENAARGGTNTRIGLATAGVLLRPARQYRQPDIVLTNYYLNDVKEPGGVGGRGRILGLKGLSVHDRLGAMAEKLAIEIRGLVPDAVQVIVGSQCSPCRLAMKYNDAIARVAKQHGIAFVDILSMCVKHKVCIWRRGTDPTHPDWLTHALYAQIVSFSVIRALSNGAWACGGSLDLSLPGFVFPKSLLDAIPTCMRPVTVYDAAAASHSADIWSNGFRLFADHADKPGWIASTVGATIVFSVSFGSSPILAISFLRSYDTFGDMEVRILNKTALLRGRWDSVRRTSETVTQWFQAESMVNQDASKYAELGVIGFGIPPFARSVNVTVTFVGSGTKAKIVDVVSC